MVQYNREILSLYVKPEKVGLKNVVSRVTWRWTVRDESDYADLYYDTYFDSVDPNNYLYQDGDTYVFMNPENYEQIQVSADIFITKLILIVLIQTIIQTTKILQMKSCLVGLML